MIFGNRYGSGGSLKMRLIIMAAIALFAVFGYLSKMGRNPVTGELQAVAMNPTEEIALGEKAQGEMANQMGGALDPRFNADAARVMAMGKRVVAISKAGQSPYRDEFDFYLLNDTKTVNAFALPGGKIFITRALYDQLENEAQLAGVLGHEIGHVIHRHSAERMAKGQLGQGLVGAVVAGSGDYTAGQVANAVSQMITLKYGREDELQSDHWGLYNMIEAGYDPREMVNVMEVLKKAGGGGGRAAVFSSHPDPDARIVAIKQYVAKQYPKGIPRELSTGERLR
jgi:predicted Zn-dependent protease